MYTGNSRLTVCTWVGTLHTVWQCRVERPYVTSKLIKQSQKVVYREGRIHSSNRHTLHSELLRTFQPLPIHLYQWCFYHIKKQPMGKRGCFISRIRMSIFHKYFFTFFLRFFIDKIRIQINFWGRIVSPCHY